MNAFKALPQTVASHFAATFRTLCLPRLAFHCKLAGIGVVYGEHSFAEASGAVIGAAHAMGAGYLTSHHMAALHDWILSRLLHEIDFAEQVRERIAADPVAYYDAATTNPAVRWAIGAVVPEYRAHLRGVRHG